MDMHFVDSFDLSQISKMQHYLELGEIEEERGKHRHPRGLWGKIWTRSFSLSLTVTAV